MRRILVSSALLSASLLTALGACRPEPESPPGPATPTNPINARTLALDSDGVIDASIVSDTAPSLDAAVIHLDTGVSGHQP
jgi:hypothetical protein